MLSGKVATVDFHITTECSQECPYCWGPQDCERPVDTDTASRIIARVAQLGARRIVFTGGDPVKRPDAVQLIRHARASGLEVALSTTGDELTRKFLDAVAGSVDLVSLPIDGSTEEVNARTKKPGHLSAVIKSLELLREHPDVDVKICVPVTTLNIDDVPNIARLVQAYAKTTKARVFFNIFQVFPRAIHSVDWDELVVGDEEFARLRQPVERATDVRVNFLDHATLDKLYVMIFPDGSLVIPRGGEYVSFGPFLAISDFDDVLTEGAFDSAKHLRHSLGWQKEGRR